MTAVDPETGSLHQINLMRQNFVPPANILGGFLFGIGIVLAGDVPVVWFSEPEKDRYLRLRDHGFFFFGVVMTIEGLLSPVHQYLKSIKVEVLERQSSAKGPI